MNVVNDGTEDCPNGDDENWDDDFFFFDGVAFNNNYTYISYSSTGLEGDVDQTGDVIITVVYTFEFSDASQDEGHWLELDMCCDDGDDGDDEDEPPTPEEAMNETDANGDDHMSYEEFEAAWNSTDENSTEEDTDAELDWEMVADLFDNCDSDVDDLINIDEMQCFVDGIVAMMGDSGDEEWYLELFSNMDWNLVNIARDDDGLVEDTNTGYYATVMPNDDDFYISAYFEPTGCPVGQHEDAVTGDCVDDAAGPEDCEGSDIWDEDTQSCVDEIIVDCAGVVDGTAYLDADGVCVEENTTVTCGDNETLETNAAGVEECVANTPEEPITCPEGETLDPLTNTCVEDTTVVTDPVDTAPNCEVFYWVGSAGNPSNNWNWTQMMEGWTEFTAPDNGEYTLALPKGDYYVYFGCWDAEGDDITLAVDGLPEIKEFEAEENWVWGWDEFSINDEDVGMQHDMVIAWSSTDFGGNVTIHFTGVDGLADSVADSETGGLPGFTASLGLMAMLGAALILARRKD
jgi:PGF-CTERM protein